MCIFFSSFLHSCNHHNSTLQLVEDFERNFNLQIKFGKGFPPFLYLRFWHHSMSQLLAQQLHLEIVNWKLNLGKKLRAPALYNVYLRLKREEENGQGKNWPRKKKTDNILTRKTWTIKVDLEKRDVDKNMHNVYVRRNNFLSLRKGLNEKKRFLSGIARMRGGVYPCLNFLALFQEVHFWSIKGVYFFKNANLLNF